MVELETTMTTTTTNTLTVEALDREYVIGQQSYLRDQHPKASHPELNDLPDYGLVLEPAVDARLRAQAEASGLDYDRLKRDFTCSHQVIPERPQDVSRTLIRERIIPLNVVQSYFEGLVNGSAMMAKGRGVAHSA